MLQKSRQDNQSCVVRAGGSAGGISRAERFSCVPSMFDSLEVQALYIT
jgi:hypothetical protein